MFDFSRQQWNYIKEKKFFNILRRDILLSSLIGSSYNVCAIISEPNRFNNLYDTIINKYELAEHYTKKKILMFIFSSNHAKSEGIAIYCVDDKELNSVNIFYSIKKSPR